MPSSWSGCNKFGYARKLYVRARKHADIVNSSGRLKVIQQQAVCTYKDVDLPLDVRLDCALEIMKDAEPLSECVCEQQETLGITGAIHKRKWEVDNQGQHLEAALSSYERGYKLGLMPATGYKTRHLEATLKCYERGHKLGSMSDATGYTGINAAFICDILARQDEESVRPSGETPANAEHLRDKARTIRAQIAEELSASAKADAKLEQDKWVRATLAEAYFGLKDHEQAKVWLGKYKESGPSEWEVEATARQLANLARFQDPGVRSWNDIKSSPAWQVLSDFLGNQNGLLASFVGKVGLALSGGGFRASLFHIGVLAKLAELDLLRHVEVISCVSGGSIIGAYYYLELQQLLQRKQDVNISEPEQAVRPEDYVEIVKRIQKNFLQGIQTNKRTLVLANPRVNFRMISRDRYSRTEYVGESYDSNLFSRIEYEENRRPLYLNDLRIHPKQINGQLDEEFNPKEGNWKRQAKVPILILNAATLNTGHYWQFTASWMGEPPSYIDTEIDSNYRLRRMYYRQAPLRPTDYQKVLIGRAVAASSCVPGLFEPIAFPDLYSSKTVSLVDGGIQDNQGITGLLEQGCTVLVVSDASGQMEAQNETKSNRLAVLFRMNSILMSRVRESQFQELDSRRRSSLLRGLMFVYLKKGLGDRPVDWIGCDEPYTAAYDVRPAAEAGQETGYGISTEVQKCLAGIRTDLDSFSEVEAFALMTSGYLMTEQEFREGKIKGFPVPEDQELAQRSDWEFLRIREVMKAGDSTDQEISRARNELIKQLAAGASSGFRIWKLKPVLRYAAVALAILVAFLAYSFIFSLWSLFTLRALVVVLAMIVAVLLIQKLMGRIVWLRDLHYGSSSVLVWAASDGSQRSFTFGPLINGSI